MDFISNIIFLQPYFLFLLILVPYILWQERKNQSPGYHAPNIFFSKIWNTHGIYWYWNILGKWCILTLVIFLLAQPVTPFHKTTVQKNWIDIAVAFDTSKSMLAEDIIPNRIESAKKVVIDFIKNIQTDRVSLIIFAGKPFISSPLSFDYSALIDIVSTITTDTIKQNIPWLSGTAIGDALLVAIEQLEEKSPKAELWDREKVIILLTDGKANIWTDPSIVGKLVKEKNIKIYPIGIGDPTWSELFTTDKNGTKQYFRWPDGKPIKADLDENMMKTLANITWGEYYNTKTNNALEFVFLELSKKIKKPIETTRTTSYISYSKELLVFILIISCTILILEKKSKPIGIP